MKIELILDMDTLTDVWAAAHMGLSSLNDKAQELSSQGSTVALSATKNAIKDLNAALSALSGEVGRAILKGRVQHEDPDRG